MIAGLNGIIEHKGVDSVVVSVGGLSFKVFIPASILSTLGAVGEKVKLHTHLYVREDTLALYGFPTPDYLTVFDMLLGVSGIGPKVALSVLSALSPDRFTHAIATENTNLFTQVPGVGKKVAARLVLELKGKIEPGKAQIFAQTIPSDHAQVMAALGSLGYTAAEAASAIASLPDTSDLSPEERIRMALAHFATR